MEIAEITVIGHSAIGESAFQLLFSAAGGLHNALALIASGVVALRPRPSATVRFVARFAAFIALGLVAGALVPSVVAVSVLGSAAATAMGLALVRRGGAAAWLPQVAVGFFGFVYGFVQYVHFAGGSHDGWGIWDVVSTVVATAGTVGVGAFAAWAIGRVPTVRNEALLGVAVLVAAGLSSLSLAR